MIIYKRNIICLDTKKPLEELQTESTVIASTRPAPSDSTTEQLTSNNDKQTTPSLPDISSATSTLNTETTDQLIRRASLGKTNIKSGMF